MASRQPAKKTTATKRSAATGTTGAGGRAATRSTADVVAFEDLPGPRQLVRCLRAMAAPALVSKPSPPRHGAVGDVMDLPKSVADRWLAAGWVETV